VTQAAPSLRFDANLNWLFTEVAFEKRFEQAAQAGFRAVEYPAPYGYSPAVLNKYLRDAGLRQVLINSPAGPVGSPDHHGSACIPDLTATFRDGLLRALEYATGLDTTVIHVMGGVRPDDVSRDAAFATYVTNIAWAAGQAEGTGVTLVLEAINQRDAPGFVLQSIDQAAAVVRAVASRHVGLLFDVYHCQVGQGDLTTRLRELLPLTAHIQVADPPARTEPGTGEIAWEHIFAEIGAAGYAGWIGCEYRPAAGTAEGLGWLRRFAGKPPSRAENPL
jgi:hydroxypyruvate isomerase